MAARYLLLPVLAQANTGRRTASGWDGPAADAEASGGGGGEPRGDGVIRCSWEAACAVLEPTSTKRAASRTDRAGRRQTQASGACFDRHEQCTEIRRRVSLKNIASANRPALEGGGRPRCPLSAWLCREHTPLPSLVLGMHAWFYMYKLHQT